MSKNNIIRLQLAKRVFKLESFLLHPFNSFLRLLSFEAIYFAVSGFGLGLSQQLDTKSKKPGCSIQKFSNLKIFDFGIEVPMDTLHGMWSEVVLASGVTMVFGKLSVQLGDVKNQSNYSNRGLVCMLLHAYALP